jgi:cation diffusion facilitator family transporter
MHHRKLQHWQHSHVFGQDARRPGETRTVIVIVITATMMVVEIVAGIAFGSMALLADGLHMASHAAALAIAAFAYVFARRRAHDSEFSFGTGKVNALGGYTGAVLLAVFALMMVWESVERLISPVAIAFNQAIAVAVVGLLVNGVSALVLQGDHDHDHGHSHDDDDHDDHHHVHEHAHHHDHNLRAAYFHVLADALTSLLAIFALLAGKFFALNWMDPAMGIVGAILVARWSWGLVAASSTVLLDKQAPERIRNAIHAAIENDGDTRIADLHVWSIGPGIYAVALAVVADEPRPPHFYTARIPDSYGVVHVTVEVHRCAPDADVESAATH